MGNLLVDQVRSFEKLRRGPHQRGLTLGTLGQMVRSSPSKGLLVPGWRGKTPTASSNDPADLASILTKLSNGSLLSQAEANNESRTNRADITLREIAADGQDDYNVEESRLRRFLAVRKSAVKAEEAQTAAWKNSPEGTAALQRSSRSPSTPPSRSSTSSRKSTPSPSKRSSSGARKAGDSTRLFGTSISRSLDADLAKVESNI